MKKIKILQAIRQGKIGGGESHVISLVQSLDPYIFESVVLSFTKGPMIDHMERLGVKTYVVETETPFNFLIWNKVKQILIKENIDIVHAHGTRANSNINFVSRKLKLPLIYTVHGWSFHQDQNSILKSIRRLGEKYLVENSKLTICVSESNLAEGKSNFPMKRSTIIKSGIDLKIYNPDKDFSNIRQELNISQNTIVVGYIVRMTKQKDPLTLVKAISLIPDDIDLRFLFVGDGDLKDAVVNLSKSLEVYHRIIFLDFRQDIPDILNAIDIYCLPSLWEGLPIGVLEAMAMRKAIVATKIDGTKEVVTHNVNGLLISILNPEELAESLILLSENQKLRKQFGDKSFEIIRQYFTVERMTNQIQAEYKKIMD